jgi:hypothetical protein
MSFSFGLTEQQKRIAAVNDRISDYANDRALQSLKEQAEIDNLTRDRQKEINLLNADAFLEASRTSAEIAKSKAKKRLADYSAGVDTTTSQEKEALMSDFERKKQLGDYDLSNQIKAWGAANKYRMSEADQSNVAQRDRLGMQLETQKAIQDKTIDQENRLRRDDYSRAVNSYTGNF